MKILFINQTLALGGAESFNRDLLSGLVANKSEVTAYTNFLSFMDMLIQSGVSTHQVPYVVDIIGNWKGLVKAIYYTPFLYFHYWQIISRNSDADLVVVSGFIEKILASPICRYYHRKIVWIEYGPLEPILNKFLGFPRFLYQWALRFPCRVIFPSRHTELHNRDIFKNYSGPTDVIPLCSPRPLSKYLSIKPHPLLAVCVSRLEPGKGQDLLIKAWKKVVSRVPKAKLQIIGEGDFRPELERLTAELQLDKSVKFLGRVDDALIHIANSSVVIFPSIWSLEGFGLVVTESMSVGRSVIAFNKGPTSEILDHNSGILVPLGDIDLLSKAIIRIFSSPILASGLGRGARKKYLREYSPSVCLSKFISAFEKCLQS